MVADWPASERPREKLLELEVEDFMTQNDSKFFSQLTKLTQVHGIGSSKYVKLQALVEVSRRVLNEQMHAKDILNSLKQVRYYLCLKLENLRWEVFFVLF